MVTSPKIKIIDDSELRNEIGILYQGMDKLSLVRWALSLGKHIFQTIDLDYKSIEEVLEGFKTAESWILGKTSINDVRQAAFKIHTCAREMKSEVKKTALRVLGHAIATAHTKEHAMVASDYAIKLIGLMYNSDLKNITAERKWQLEEIRKCV